MDPIFSIGAIISLILAIKAQADTSTSNIRTCKLISRRCRDLVPSLESIKSKPDEKINTQIYNDSLQTLIEVLDDCKTFITMCGNMEIIVQFFSSNSVEIKFKELNKRLTASIINLDLANPIDEVKLLKEIQEALSSDLNKIKATLSEIAAANNFRIDQIQNNQSDNEPMEHFIKALVDNVNELRTAVNPVSSSTSSQSNKDSALASTSTFSLVDESQLIKGDIIGHGSYGEVFKCLYRNQDFALKLFEKSFARGGLNSIEVRKISREVQILKLCHHSNIISFVAATVNTDKAMLITELATCSLYTVIHDDSPIDVTFPSKVRWLADVARGLRYLHFHQITHRDLKPANILLVHKETADGRELVVAKIADFGVSSAVGLTTRRTGVKVEQVGTCSYDAPEVCDEALYTASSDIYAFGITANELLTGALPWIDCRNDGHIVRMVGQGKRPELFVPTSEAEVELMRIIGSSTSQCLAQEATLRPIASVLYSDLTKASASLDRGKPSVATRELVKAPECPVCLAEYADSRKCYLICAGGHSLCETCRKPAIEVGACPICSGPCLPGGGVVNQEVMGFVSSVAAINSAPIQTIEIYTAATMDSSLNSVSSDLAPVPTTPPTMRPPSPSPVATTTPPQVAQASPVQISTPRSVTYEALQGHSRVRNYHLLL